MIKHYDSSNHYSLVYETEVGRPKTDITAIPLIHHILIENFNTAKKRYI